MNFQGVAKLFLVKIKEQQYGIFNIIVIFDKGLTTSACCEYERMRHQTRTTSSPSTDIASSSNHNSTPSSHTLTPSTSTGSLPKRPATKSSPYHPWHFKKTKTKTRPNQMITKSVCLLDTPPNFDEMDDESSINIPDYPLVNNMILIKGYCDIGTSYCEQDIRKEIAEILQQKFPAITEGLFDFVKRERNLVVTPVVKPTHKWDFKQLRGVWSEQVIQYCAKVLGIPLFASHVKANI